MKFDLTSEDTTTAAVAAAKDLGVEQVYGDHAPKTGYVLLFDTASKKVVGKLTKVLSSEEWHAEIDKALGGA